MWHPIYIDDCQVIAFAIFIVQQGFRVSLVKCTVPFTIQRQVSFFIKVPIIFDDQLWLKELEPLVKFFLMIFVFQIQL